MDKVELQVGYLSEGEVLDIIERTEDGALDDWNVENWMGTTWAELSFYDLDADEVVLEDIIDALEDAGGKVGYTRG